MKELMQDVRAGWQKTRDTSLPTSRPEGSGLKPVAVGLELQSPAGLLAVLTTIARLGCQLTHVQAAGKDACVRVLAPLQVAHRVVPCLGQVIEVIAVREIPDAELAFA